MLVGVDDSDEYCERSDPTISSVRRDVEAGGEEAARLLAALMARTVGDRLPRFLAMILM